MLYIKKDILPKFHTYLGFLAKRIFILRSQGAFPPGFYLPREGWVYRPAPEAPLIRGMPTGPEAFLEPAGCAWATALHQDPP